jgi:hypothetical protein
MSDYISRESVLEHYRVTDPAGTFAYCDSILDFVSNLPAADVKPVVRGKWKLLDGGKGQCQECQSVFKDVWDYDKSDSFCRGCGADMR